MCNFQSEQLRVAVESGVDVGVVAFTTSADPTGIFFYGFWVWDLYWPEL